MHNNIMAAGSKDRPPMLGPGRYSQWRSRFLWYIDTKPNGGGLKKSILSGPYVPTTVQVQAVEATEVRPAVPQHTSVETILNMNPENKEHFQSEKEVIFLLLTGIGDEIYSTVDACNTANEIWIAIKRLQQGESLNVQDVKTNLFWEFGKFTSRDGESMESYYLRFYKLMKWSTEGGAPRAWYDELSNFLMSKGFSKGTIDPTLFKIKYEEDILLVQIYVDDIIFGSTNPKYSKRFEKLMHNRFEISLIGEMKFFLGLQIHQSLKGIFINQAKYTLEIMKKHNMDNCHSIGIPLATKPKLDVDLSGEPVDQSDYRSKIGPLMYLTSSRPDLVQAYPKDSGFELTAFSDADHAGCLDTQKSTFGGIQFLGDKLVSWMSKKQNCTAMSSAEAKTEYQLADMFTKALPEDRFKYLVRRIGMRCLTPAELEVLTNESA
ncbi:retrovirus-related pol polyprotein from transposon TNT 1-94 [Tanacetum coccineum]